MHSFLFSKGMHSFCSLLIGMIFMMKLGVVCFYCINNVPFAKFEMSGGCHTEKDEHSFLSMTQGCIEYLSPVVFSGLLSKSANSDPILQGGLYSTLRHMRLAQNHVEGTVLVL